MSGPRFSIARENRSTTSRAPVRSSELISMRQRSHANARRILSMSDPIEPGVKLRIATDQLDEQLFQCFANPRAGPQLFDAPLRHDSAVRNHPDMRRESLDDLEDVRGQE